jgi:hypothetical protein
MKFVYTTLGIIVEGSKLHDANFSMHKGNPNVLDAEVQCTAVSQRLYTMAYTLSYSTASTLQALGLQAWGGMG